jgi:hypothetical protein
VSTWLASLLVVSLSLVACGEAAPSGSPSRSSSPPAPPADPVVTTRGVFAASAGDLVGRCEVLMQPSHEREAWYRVTHELALPDGWQRNEVTQLGVWEWVGPAGEQIREGDLVEVTSHGETVGECHELPELQVSHIVPASVGGDVLLRVEIQQGPFIAAEGSVRSFGLEADGRLVIHRQYRPGEEIALQSGRYVAFVLDAACSFGPPCVGLRASYRCEPPVRFDSPGEYTLTMTPTMGTDCEVEIRSGTN